MLIPKIDQRINQYLDFLEKNAYKKIDDLKFEMFEADKVYRCPPENAKWEKIETPAPWGKEWKCFWFRTVYHVPKSDKAIFLSVIPNADSLVFIDGKPAGAFNMYHKKIRIDADGLDHTLHVESYAGHLHAGCGPFEGSSIYLNLGKTIPNYPNTFEGGSILERRQAVHSLFYDIRALFETAKIADANSLRKAKILKGISDALSVVSLCADGDELEKQSAVALRMLAPLLALKNSPTVPSVHMVGHAHIDHAWLWHIEETERKLARTFINMIRFMKEYPEFIFFQSQPCQLEIIHREYPEIFEEIKKAYKNGKWEPNGGMWVEADCNVPSGESLVRQFLVGKKVNKELLDYEADTLWLPDVFGYAAALPQIMAGCRIKYFVTSKINWNDTTRFPYETFIWRGIDGTGVKVHFLSTIGSGAGYNGKVVPIELNDIWAAVQHKEVQSACVKSIGEGDGGGGTLRADLEMARRLGDLEGAPRAAWKTVSSALNEIFNDDTEGTFPEWCGELYLELHRGTYTTQSRTKRYNRLMEFALRKMEFLYAVSVLAGKDDKDAKVTDILLDYWKRVLTYHFHDIIPGSSITRVYTEAEADYAVMLSHLDEMSFETKKRLTNLESGNESVVVFNDLSWEYTPIVNIIENSEDSLPIALLDADGTIYPVQQYTGIDGKKRGEFAIKVPSMGFAGYKISKEKPALENNSSFSWSNNKLETPFYTITFDVTGRIISLFDKRQERETIAKDSAFNALITAEDVPAFWDAWDIDADWTTRIKQETELISTEVVSDGAVCFRLRRIYKISDVSQVVQDMVCYAANPRIDFETKVDWHEKWRVLKVEFDTAISTAQVRCEVQYGHLWRNTHRNLMQDRAKFEICAHKWISLEEEGGGVALLNDCKYGHDVEGGKMRLTLLRSPIAPDPEADRGEHYFTYSILPFNGSFGNSGVIRSAYELNSPATAVFGSGSSVQNQSFCSVSGNSVIIECVKVPEHGNKNELILRLYESLGGKCRTTLNFANDLISAAETDMLEDNPKSLPVQGQRLELEFRAFEIKTIRVALAG